MPKGMQSLSRSLTTGLVGCVCLNPSSLIVEWKAFGLLGCKATYSKSSWAKCFASGGRCWGWPAQPSGFSFSKLTSWQSSLCGSESLENWDNASPSPRPHHFSKEMIVLTIIRGIKQDSICKVLRLNGVTMSLTLDRNVLFFTCHGVMNTRLDLYQAAV